jgi:hypothetical protein
LGTISAFALNTGKPRKTCAEVAGRRTFRILTASQCGLPTYEHRARLEVLAAYC